MIWDIYRPVLVSVLPKIGKRPDWTGLSSTSYLCGFMFCLCGLWELVKECVANEYVFGKSGYVWRNEYMQKKSAGTSSVFQDFSADEWWVEGPGMQLLCPEMSSSVCWGDPYGDSAMSAFCGLMNWHAWICNPLHHGVHRTGSSALMHVLWGIWGTGTKWLPQWWPWIRHWSHLKIQWSAWWVGQRKPRYWSMNQFSV